MQYDVLIRNGTVIDGTGDAPVEADVAIRGNRIVGVGEITRGGAEEIEARGKLVTPGFVDIHTHYDAQAVWDVRINLSPPEPLADRGADHWGGEDPLAYIDLVRRQVVVNLELLVEVGAIRRAAAAE